MQIEAVERALSQLSSQADVGPSSTYSAMLPAILMPMHVAVDATPFAVRNTLGASYFLKLYAPEMLRFIDLPAALEASKAAGALGIGPAVIADAPDAGAILFEMLPADTWRMASRQDLRSPSALEAIVQAKRAWHRSPPLTRTRDPFDVIRSYLLQLDAIGDGAGAPPAFGMLKAWINRAEQTTAASGQDIGPLHGENTISNVMLGPDGRVMLVDFDHAANGDPYYDLGAFCIECCSFVDEVEAVVSMYLGASDKRVLARVLVYMFVDDFLWGCWGLIAQAISPRSGRHRVLQICAEPLRSVSILAGADRLRQNPARTLRVTIMKLGDASTPSEYAAEAAIGKVPLWRGKPINYERIAAGITNINWRITAPEEGRRYFLKIPGANTSIFIDRKLAKEAATKIADTGYAPRMVFYDDDEDIEVQEYLEGFRSCNVSDLLDPVIRANVVKAYKKIHETQSLSKAKPGFEQLTEPVGGRRANMARRCRATSTISFQRCDRAREKLEKNPVRLCACYNDGYVSNYMVDDEKNVRIIDWEYAANNDPYWDLSMLSFENFFNPSVVRETIELHDGLLYRGRWRLECSSMRG